MVAGGTSTVLGALGLASFPGPCSQGTPVTPPCPASPRCHLSEKPLLAIAMATPRRVASDQPSRVLLWHLAELTQEELPGVPCIPYGGNAVRRGQLWPRVWRCRVLGLEPGCPQPPPGLLETALPAARPRPCDPGVYAGGEGCTLDLAITVQLPDQARSPFS